MESDGLRASAKAENRASKSIFLIAIAKTSISFKFILPRVMRQMTLKIFDQMLSNGQM